jgi:hypothetical protein
MQTDGLFHVCLLCPCVCTPFCRCKLCLAEIILFLCLQLVFTGLISNNGVEDKIRDYLALAVQFLMITADKIGKT